MLVALLQRTPVVRLATTAEEFVLAAPAGTLLRSAVGAVASLGALHSLAGATTLQTNGHPSPFNVTAGTAVPTVFFTVTGTQSAPGSWRIGGSIPPGLSFSGRTTPGTVNVSTLQLSGAPTTANQYAVTLQAFEGPNLSLTSSPVYTYVINVAAATATPPAITSPPSNQTVSAGGAAVFAVAATGSPAPSFQWQRNGVNLAGQSGTTLTLSAVQPSDTGLYQVVATNASGSTTSASALLGLSSMAKVIGDGSVIGENIVHPNHNIFDQVLLTGVAETLTADPGQVTRTSYIDLNDDIVQVEFSGAGTLSLVLDDSSGPAAPVNYNQPTVNYMKGHAGIVITGADDTTNVSVFTVGRATAFDPTGGYNILLPPGDANNPANNGSSLFQGHDTTNYDGIAGIAFIAIASTNGKFGGVRTSDATYFATQGMTGIYAPGVQFTGPVFIGDISAFNTATPVILLGSVSDARITGGDLLQDNDQPVQVSGISQLKFTAGIDSQGNPLPAQSNQGTLQQNGSDVTAQIVVNPAP